MEKTIFYVALVSQFDFCNPTIIEQFENEDDANTYAALMAKTKKRKYAIFKQVRAFDETEK